MLPEIPIGTDDREDQDFDPNLDGIEQAATSQPVSFPSRSVDRSQQLSFRLVDGIQIIPRDIPLPQRKTNFPVDPKRGI